MTELAKDWSLWDSKSGEGKKSLKSQTKTVSERDTLDIATIPGQTDAAHATRFVNLFAKEVLYVPPWKRWLAWDGKRWADDNGVGCLQRAKRYSKSLWNELARIAPTCDRDELGKVSTAIKQANQTSKIHSFLELAAVDARVVAQVDELNSHPKLLNVANGTIDLKTGELLPHNPAHRLTQLADIKYDADASCPQWENTLSLIFAGDAELIRYVQRLLGYSISGDTGEHILPMAYGKGNNGKSTVWNAVAELLGDYAFLANDELILGTKSTHPADKAALYQKRFVAVSEPEQNSRLRESRVKELTGDRTITARGMKENFWSFERTHTFWMSTNHLPRIDGVDDGIWRRVKLIPFTQDLAKVTTPIKDFDRWLVANEGPGILAWLIRGYLDYQQNGLEDPAAVRNATREFRGDSDPLGDFLADHCEEDPKGFVGASQLYRIYADNGGSWSQTAFGRAMAARYQKDRPTAGEHRRKTVYRGLKLKSETVDT